LKEVRKFVFVRKQEIISITYIFLLIIKALKYIILYLIRIRIKYK